MVGWLGCCRGGRLDGWLYGCLFVFVFLLLACLVGRLDVRLADWLGIELVA